MATQKALDTAYINVAYAISQLSVARRKKVGAILVAAGGGIIAEGYNGTPSGFDNNCENALYYYGTCPEIRQEKAWIDKFCIKQTNGTWLSPANAIITELLITKKEVLHAESNAITKVAQSTNSSTGATLFVTLAPCFDCSKLIIQAGIKRVVYAEMYKTDDGQPKLDGIELLTKAGIKVDKYEATMV